MFSEQNTEATIRDSQSVSPLSGKRSRRIIRPITCLLVGLLLTALIGITALAGRLERPFMRLIGGIVGSVKDHPARVVAIAVAAGILVWALIGLSCWLDARRARRGQQHDHDAR